MAALLKYVNSTTLDEVFTTLIFLLMCLFGFPYLGWQAIGQGQHS
jgi:hypothetical protein